ncbi:hypothetical protein AB0B85_01795 [Micromonospora sp. NPDC049044]|uniref:hypothetical protein n=1 Tax=unclassified Micromonospora TaxID=2617518 RepID=UPI0033E08C26
MNTRRGTPFALDAGLYEPVFRAAEQDGIVPALRALSVLMEAEPPAHRDGGVAASVIGGVPGVPPLAGFTLPGGAVSFGRGAPFLAPDRWRLGLLWLRLGSSAGRRRTCVRWLASRRSGGGDLLRFQMIKGQLADVLVEHQEIAAALDGISLSPAMTLHLHDRITAADRAVLGLFGAAGFLRDGPGGEAHVSELLADVYAEGRG